MVRGTKVDRRKGHHRVQAAVSVSDALAAAIPGVTSLWTADSMVSGADVALIDQVGSYDLAKIIGAPTLNGLDADYGGRKTLSVGVAAGGYQNSDLDLDGPATVLLLVDLASYSSFPYLFDGSAAGGRGYAYVSSTSQVISSFSAGVPPGVVVAATPILFAFTRESSGASVSRSFTAADGAAAVAARVTNTTGPYVGFTLGMRYSSSSGIAGRLAFGAVCDGYAFDAADAGALASEVNSLFSLSLPTGV